MHTDDAKQTVGSRVCALQGSICETGKAEQRADPACCGVVCGRDASVVLLCPHTRIIHTERDTGFNARMAGGTIQCFVSEFSHTKHPHKS